MDPLILIIISVVGAVVVVFSLIQTVGRLLRKVGPNQALIVYGAGGTKVITGGSHFVLPLYQRAQDFSLELMSFDVAPSQDLYTTQGVAVNVEAVTQIKVRSDDESVKTAAEQFLSKSQQERERSEEHTSELQSHLNLVCRLLLEKKNIKTRSHH